MEGRLEGWSLGNSHLELVRSQSGRITLGIFLHFYYMLFMSKMQWLIICCSELHLATTWPRLTEGLVVDNDVYR